MEHVQEFQLTQHDLTILTLYEKSIALIINGFVLGSKSSRYITSVHVMVKRNATDSHLQLALIHHFLQVDIWHTCDEPYSENRACTKWFASIVSISVVFGMILQLKYGLLWLHKIFYLMDQVLCSIFEAKCKLWQNNWYWESLDCVITIN